MKPFYEETINATTLDDVSARAPELKRIIAEKGKDIHWVIFELRSDFENKKAFITLTDREPT